MTKGDFMNLHNIIIVKGQYDELSRVESELSKLKRNSKESKLHDPKINKNIKGLKTNGVVLEGYDANLTISFDYKKLNVLTFIEKFKQFNVELNYMTYQEKSQIWIVNDYQSIEQYHFIPEFAMNDILIDYMEYKEASIMLDSYETLHLDRNSQCVVINKDKPKDKDLLNIFFNKSIKGKIIYQLLDNFINSYYQKCINTYEQLYSSNKEEVRNEEPSPLALFIITFGIFAIIGLLLVMMGYF